jgi:DNA invertase Pin-like site-specific DNA recombinase
MQYRRNLQSADVPHSMRAAEYIRMSTEHRQYSTLNQGDKIREYAARRGLEIVRTYMDEGKSGLKISGRSGSQQLLKDVESNECDFQVVLVYDVSRWSRFQDADESAYYEYVCKRAGVDIAYCAEQFENDGSPVSTNVKGVKRAMAGEYSRELSAKVFAGQCRLIELGYRQSGPAGFGLRRKLIDSAGRDNGTLNPGEYKSIQTDRIVLSPGPEDEVQVVEQIYSWFVNDGVGEAEIAKRLNQIGICNDHGLRWTSGTMNEVLTNEKYIGNNVFNRTSFKLKARRVDNPSDMWIRKEQAFPGIVSRDLFFIVHGIIKARSRCYSIDELILRLSSLYK